MRFFYCTETNSSPNDWADADLAAAEAHADGVRGFVAVMGWDPERPDHDRDEAAGFGRRAAAAAGLAAAGALATTAPGPAGWN